MIQSDVTSIRSMAISTGSRHRFNFISDTQWQIEYYDDSAMPAKWSVKGSSQTLPTDTALMAGSLENAEANLEASSRGIFSFENEACGSPYVTLESRGTSRIKSIYVFVGGAIRVETQ